MTSSLALLQQCSLSIHPSPIHGNGLFAGQDFEGGALIYESSEYTISPHAIYASIQRIPTEHLLEKFLRWENHSCQPNTILRFAGSKVQLFALCSIVAGEEFVCDYRSTESSIPTPFRCNCGHCEGILIR